MSEAMWMTLGVLGQIAFGSRFVIQWISSERRRKSIFPISFWYASLLGTALLLPYAIHIKDPVFTMGQAFGAIVYIRNLVLLRNEATG